MSTKAEESLVVAFCSVLSSKKGVTFRNLRKRNPEEYILETEKLPHFEE